MNYSLVLVTALILTFCHQADLGTDAEYSTLEATLSNQLPVDGCDWHFNVNLGSESMMYVPNENSKPGVDAIIQSLQTLSSNGLYSTRVEITYKLTGLKQKVLCGWNRTTEMDEIDIKFIKKI